MKPIFFLILFLLNASCWNKSGEEKFYLEREFEVAFDGKKDTLIFKARTWGVAGNHSETILFNKNGIREKTLTFYDSELFFKQSGNDTLVIYGGAFDGVLEDLSDKIRFIHVQRFDFQDVFSNSEKYGVTLVSARKYDE